MNIALRLTVLVSGLVFFAFIFRLLYVKHLEERNALLWISSILVMFVLIVFPGILDVLAFQLGIDYPPALLFLASTLVIMLILIHQAIQISMLHKRVKELAELAAIHSYIKHPCEETDKGGYDIDHDKI